MSTFPPVLLSWRSSSSKTTSSTFVALDQSYLEFHGVNLSALQTLHRQNKHAESWTLSKCSLTVKPTVFSSTCRWHATLTTLSRRKEEVIIRTNIDLFIVWNNIPQLGLSIVSLQRPFLGAMSHESWTLNAKWQIWNNNCFFCIFSLGI